MAVQATSLKARSGRPYTLLGIVLAVLGFGVVLLFGIFSGAGGHAPAVVSGQSEVIVASRDISARTSIAPADLSVSHYSTADVPPGAFTKPDELKALVAAIDIKKGQAITSNLVVKDADVVVGPQSAFLPIPSGFVAVTIPTGEQTGVAGYIQAGDYISMIAIVAAQKGQNIRTVFTNIHILKVGPATSEAKTGTPKTGGLSSSLTIVVTACQAEYINWFLTNAALRYVLESYKDYKPQDVAIDQSCPSVTAAGGVKLSDVAGRWPGIFGN